MNEYSYILYDEEQGWKINQKYRRTKEMNRKIIPHFYLTLCKKTHMDHNLMFTFITHNKETSSFSSSSKKSFEFYYYIYKEKNSMTI